MAEKTVQTVKRIFNKYKVNGHEPLLALLQYKATPLNIGYSPAQLLLVMGRQVRSILPTMQSLLLPKTPTTRQTKLALTQNKQKAKSYNDQNAKPLPRFDANDLISVHDKRW